MEKETEVKNSGELPIMERIKQYSAACSKGHRKIALYILENYINASYMTASNLAKEVGISESTVVRFAMDIGFEGYPELQAALKSMLKNKLTSIERIAIASERMGDDVLTATLNAEIENLRSTLANTDRDNFDSIVDMILYAKTVYIVGNRSSTSLANFMYFYISLIFDKVRLVQSVSGSDIFEQLFRIGEGDVVIGITFPRYSKRTVDAMTFAHRSSAFTVAITDSDNSPIVPISDKVLYAKNEVSSFVDSLVAPMALINALVSALGQKKKKEVSKNFEKLERIWDEYSIYDKNR
ncbi:MAG: MurR/RpiR family transcriptional regulator [Eubacteriales bacterium]|nr:MurR/RpiR family transcriptional regulator [Eubacteriales bacterium]